MKTLQCDRCDFTAEGETFDAWMEALKPHYKEAHADFMAEQEKRPPEAQHAEMKKWMEENKSRFENAE